MQWERFALVSILLFSAVITGVLAYCTHRRRDRTGAKAVLIALTIDSLGYACEIASNTLPQVLFWLKVEYLSLSYLPFLLIILVFRYTGRDNWLKPPVRMSLFIFSTLIMVAHYTDQLHHLYYHQISLDVSGHFPIASIVVGPLYWVFAIYINLSLLFCNLLLFQMWQKALQPYRRQIGIMVLGSLAPWLAFIIYLFRLSTWEIDVSTLAMTLSGIVFAWGLFHHQLFDLEPIAHEKVLDSIREAVLVLDIQNRIVNYNPAAPSILKELTDAVIGQRAVVVFDQHPEISALILSDLDHHELVLDNRSFDIRQSFIFGNRQDLIGKAIIIRDISQQKQAQALLIQSEKTIVLGQLVANVAHELNTPLGTIKATAENMEVSFDRLWHLIPELLQLKDLQHQQLLLDLIQAVQSIPKLTTREERDDTRVATIRLQQLGFTYAQEIARRLAKLGLVPSLEHFLPLFNDETAIALTETILEIALQRKNIDNILQAEERTAKIMYALKNYSHLPVNEQPILIDVRSGVETVLQMYGNLLKNGIEITTDFQLTSQILANPVELEQIWTNLIHNAIQAMDGSGWLIIATQECSDEIIVSFTDNGPGIAANLIPQIFEPFFTTKPVGEGSGLGLAICKEIVERHHGCIEVQSSPGLTRFAVHLPLPHSSQDCQTGEVAAHG